jgi:hypothetical protein
VRSEQVRSAQAAKIVYSEIVKENHDYIGLPGAAFNPADAWVEAKAPASRDLRDICIGPVYCNQCRQVAKLTFQILAIRIT